MTLDEAVKALDTAQSAACAAESVCGAARAAVIAEAKRLGIEWPTVRVVGQVAWYIYPPGAPATRFGDWVVTYGPAPKGAAP